MADARHEMDLSQRIAAIGIVPVVRLPKADLAIRLAETLAAAGIPCLEVTFRAEGAPGAIAAIRQSRPDVLVGAGTVLTVEQAEAAIDAGAQFLVSPGTNLRVVDYVQAHGARMIPGVATPSEIEMNLERGISLLKFFPAEPMGGAAFLRSVQGPFENARFIPSGGVTAENLASYLALANVPAVGGTWIAPLAELQSADFEAIGHRAREAAARVRDARTMGESG